MTSVQSVVLNRPVHARVFKISVSALVLSFLSVSCTHDEQVQAESGNTEESVVVLEEIARQIDEIANLQVMQRAFEYIEQFDDQTVENQIRINEVPAPPFSEQNRAEKYAGMMMEYGLSSVDTDDEGNVIGYRAGSSGSRTVVVSAHLDTVFPEETDVAVDIRSDTLFAPGITDDARGLTSVLTILRVMEELDIQTEADVWFVGTVGEEGLGDLRGVKYLFRENPDIDAFISIDGSNLNQITSRALGSHRYRVTFEGPGGHSWSAFGTANTAHALGRAIYYFDSRASDFVSEGMKTSYNIGRIGGGTSVNSIPYSNWMEVDIRSVDQNALVDIDRILQESIRDALDETNEMRSSGEELTVQVEMIGNRPSGEIEPEHPFIQRAVASAVYAGGEPYLHRSSTDSNVPISLGIPSVTIGGGGSGGEMHSLDEWWYNDEGYRGIQRALLLLVAEAGLSE